MTHSRHICGKLDEFTDRLWGLAKQRKERHCRAKRPSGSDEQMVAAGEVGALVREDGIDRRTIEVTNEALGRHDDAGTTGKAERERPIVRQP